MQSHDALILIHRQRLRELQQAAENAHLLRQAQGLREHGSQRNPALKWRLYRIISLFLAV